MTRRVFWLAVSCSVGWHLRSLLEWAGHRAGETHRGAPSIRITTR